MSRPLLTAAAAASLGVALGALVAEAVASSAVLFVAAGAGLVVALALLLMRRPAAPETASVERATAAGWEYFRREMKRSRRQEYPLALIRMPVTMAGVTRRGRLAERQRVAGLVARQLRVTDHVWLDGRDVYALLTDTHREMAANLLDRLHRALPDVADWDEVRLAAFPGDGVTAGKLLRALQEPAPAAGPSATPAPRLTRLEPDSHT